MNKTITKNAEDIPQPINLDVLKDKLGYHLRIVERNINKGRQFTKAVNLTIVQYSVFSVIATNEGASQVAIGEALGMDKPSVMTVINRLQDDGLVERRTSPQDKRSHALYLSAKGRKEFTVVEKNVKTYDNQFKNKLTADEFVTLIRILSVLCQNHQ